MEKDTCVWRTSVSVGTAAVEAARGDVFARHVFGLLYRLRSRTLAWREGGNGRMCYNELIYTMMKFPSPAAEAGGTISGVEKRATRCQQRLPKNGQQKKT